MKSRYKSQVKTKKLLKREREREKERERERERHSLSLVLSYTFKNTKLVN